MTEQPAKFRFIGQPLPRTEDARLLTGRGQFSDDFCLPGQTYAAIVRSPHAHARIVRIDTASAKKMPGVLGVFTGTDCQADNLGAIPHDPLPKTRYDMKLHGPGGGEVFFGPHVLLPTDKVRHVGEAVAMVVAETQSQANDASEAVEVTYETLPCVLHAEDAMKPDAPIVWDEAANNILVDTSFGHAAETDRILANAAHVVRKEFHVGRVTGVPMEPRAAVAHYDNATERYTIYAGSGGAVRQKRELAAVLGIDPKKFACCPTMSAEILAHAIASTSNLAWRFGLPARSAVQLNTLPRVRNVSSATTRAATWSLNLNLPLTSADDFWHCARPISAM